ncbi:MAG: four helix bundle protein [Clostridiales bacterium]|nr:four helix bundle protein [Clostridiales bacterium]MBQ2816926.1 four helix bundle protein [Clostridia bacterium]MBQ4637348.1 four helix bundle protein [Clostridia bacterium]
MKGRTIKELAIELVVEVTAVCDGIRGRSVFINQLLRSCSSIGANSHEAHYAQSPADFVHKMEIALKECYETDYWFEVLYKIEAIDLRTYRRLSNMSGTIRRMLIASVTTVKSKYLDISDENERNIP